jgi:hypothetical protein
LIILNTRLISTSRNVGITASICIGATIVMVLFGGGKIILMNPFVKGYLHVGFEHALTNFIMLFALLLAPINREYDFKKIYWVTLIISLLYLPTELLGVSQTALGLSGTCYFLLSRYFFSWKERSLLGAFIIGTIALLELGAGINPGSSNSAHWVHLLGIALGWTSIKYRHKKILAKLGL